MINAFKALGWLNTIDNCSRLKNEDYHLIRAIGNLGLFDFRIEPILERLRNTARSPGEPLRNAEILLYCAAIGHGHGESPQAACDAREAMLSYENDHHRRAVALWILGYIQWEMSQNHEAYKNWREAKEIFKQCQGSFQPSPGEKDWYREPIWQMEVDLVARPDEIWTWLNRFEASNLKPATGFIVECVWDKIHKKAYPSIYVLMQELQDALGRSERIFERAEIYLEFGVAMYYMGNSHFAMELLRKAVMNFHPGIGTYHKQAVSRCLLGAVEWMHRLSHKQAAEDWLGCIKEFENLQRWAGRDHFPKKEKWYSERCAILRSALLERVEPAKPSPSTPGKEKAYSYDNLLSRVGWDHGNADRRIEYERKKAPMVDRNELIRRAIKRLIRDNQ